MEDTYEVNEQLLTTCSQWLGVHPLHLTSSDLMSKWGFGDGDAVADFYSVLEALGYVEPYNDGDNAAADYEVTDRILAHLVHDLLILPLASRGSVVETRIWGTSHNPIRRHSVNGIVDADVPEISTRVTPEDLASATTKALASDAYPTMAAPEVPSAHEAGLVALVGRHVEIYQFLAGPDDDPVMGTLVAVTPEDLTVLSLRFDGVVTVVPRTTVRYVQTGSLTTAEEDLFERTFQ